MASSPRVPVRRRVVAPLGSHLLVDASGAQRDHLADVERVRLAIARIVEALALTAVGPIEVHDGGHVIAGLVLIAESHISVHTLPAEGRVLADVFSCRPFDADAAVLVLEEQFRFTAHTQTIVQRGGEP